MGKKQSLRSKATHLVSVLLNPISDSDANSNKPSKHPLPTPPPPNGEVGESEITDEEGSHDLVDGPDTSSFTAFLYSFLSSSDTGDNANAHGHNYDKAAPDNNPLPDSSLKENGGKKSLLSRSKQSVGRAIRQAARMGGFRHQDRKDNLQMKFDDGNGVEMRPIEPVQETVPVPLVDLPEISEPSALLSDSIRNVLYASLPSLMHGRKWLLLYSTWRHGISLSTLYRRSMLWPGLSLLVVGDRKGAVFGGLVEAPLRSSNKKKYQGTNNSYVFTNTSGHPVIYRPTGVNRYFTLCNTDYLAIGGGGHFALYLDGDLLNGSSSVSETYGNPCLANSEDFEVKEVELWGFVYASKYEEILALSRTEEPGICRW
ncbi:TLD domain-containing protein 2 [Abrus precatorius]|uniref:Oxidation resistance protein 1 n=1 Tax=Abrus precatorius TaxID=3816 RepID=A0A8B8K3W4_ABRPR|nr:TLD domain-containing protein 2 [Abrus precatorius]